jgi:hypothetical protein
MARANPDNSMTTPPQPPTSQERGDELLMRWRLARAAGVPAELRFDDVRCECLMCLAEGENSPHLAAAPAACGVRGFVFPSTPTRTGRTKGLPVTLLSRLKGYPAETCLPASPFFQSPSQPPLRLLPIRSTRPSTGTEKPMPPTGLRSRRPSVSETIGGASRKSRAMTKTMLSISSSARQRPRLPAYSPSSITCARSRRARTMDARRAIGHRARPDRELNCIPQKRRGAVTAD